LWNAQSYKLRECEIKLLSGKLHLITIKVVRGGAQCRFPRFAVNSPAGGFIELSSLWKQWHHILWTPNRAPQMHSTDSIKGTSWKLDWINECAAAEEEWAFCIKNLEITGFRFWRQREENELWKVLCCCDESRCLAHSIEINCVGKYDGLFLSYCDWGIKCKVPPNAAPHCRGHICARVNEFL
jgi:hypothetical protein